MKVLALLFLLTACGKHLMPEEKSFYDSDGDQIPDSYEASDFDKFVANVTPVGKVQALLRFRQGKVSPTDSTIELENNTDISSYSKDLLLKSINSLSIEDYFSQYTLLSVKKEKALASINQDIIFATFELPDNQQSMNLSLITKDKTELLGSFRRSMDIKLTKELIETILKGDAVLALSSNDRKEFMPPPQDVTLKSKTYRVFYDDGIETKIIFVSKDMSFEKFLEILEITELHSVEDVDLLSTNYFYRTPVWWVRNLNPQDRVLVKEDIKNLSNYLLGSFAQGSAQINRINGSVQGTLTIHKNSSARALIKIRGNQELNAFREFTHTTKEKTGSAYHGTDITYTCKVHNRELQARTQVVVDEALLRRTLKVVVNQEPRTDYILIPGKDETGVFWEVQILDGVTKFDVYLENLPAHTYAAVGIFAADCDYGGTRPPINAPSVNLEAQLNIFIESFVEKI